MTKSKSFSFGKNWENFLKYITDKRIETAKSSIIDFLGVNSLEGKSFLDIGCGSGLFSYAACVLGATRIVSFDADKFSVRNCKFLWKKANNPEEWKVHVGSILDVEFTSILGCFDIVYSWGVLHHTGHMWRAIINSANLVKNGGYFYFTIYNKVNGLRGSDFWLKIKRLYN